ncbi:MAG: cupin domain-containing protein [Thermomicrobiales bacterium]
MRLPSELPAADTRETAEGKSMLEQGLRLTIGDQPPHEPFPGVEVWSISSDTMMLALIRLAPDAVVPPHEHDNEQCGTVVSGTMTLSIGDVTRAMTAGQGYLIPPGVTHTATAGPEGSLVIDVFAPPREAYRMPAETRSSDDE